MSRLSELLRIVRDLDTDQRWMVAFALLFALSGLLHVPVWLVDGGPWDGDVSWRKPIVFGLSGALATGSLAWALGAVTPSRVRTRGVWIHLTAMTIEIALIDMQRWRGVASHFNMATPFDAVVFQLMGVLILAASVPAVRWAVHVARARHLPPERRAAVGGGLALFIIGIVLGIIIAQLGSVGRMAEVPALVRAARGLVPAHAIALHGLQVMLVASIVLPRWTDDAALRTRLLGRIAMAVLALAATVAVIGVCA